MITNRRSACAAIDEYKSVRSFFWGDLTGEEFRGLDQERSTVILPVAAIEQARAVPAGSDRYGDD
jgi:hypothetical protein